MEFKNLKITNLLSKKAIALATAGFLALTPLGTLNTNAEVIGANATINNRAMDYFRDLQDDVEDYLDKSQSKTNLSNALECYNKLYEFIYNGTKVRDTYYSYLSTYEQYELQYLLLELGNEIYEEYKSASYFTTTTKSVLGFTLKYQSTESGYEYNHEQTMERYTVTLKKTIRENLRENQSKTYLQKALNEYKSLINFIKGNTKTYGYYFDELTITEKEDIINLLLDCTEDIFYEYGDYYYYPETCISSVGFTVNTTNIYRELGSYIGENNNIFTPVEPIIPTVPVQPTIPTVPVQPTIPSIESQPTIPSVVPSINSNEINNNIQNNGLNVNNSIQTNWFQFYHNPTIDTSRSVPDYVPESINGFDDYDDPMRYPQPYPYSSGNEYVEDYALKYIPR